MFKFYCYDCILPVGNITDQIPHVPLPVSCDMYVVVVYFFCTCLYLLLFFLGALRNLALSSFCVCGVCGCVCGCVCATVSTTPPRDEARAQRWYVRTPGGVVHPAAHTHTRTHHQQQPLHFSSQHAKILSPELVSVHTFPDLPDYNPDEVFLLYPSKVCTSPFCVSGSRSSSSELTFYSVWRAGREKH
jgi:hypothetical protein